MTAYDLPADPRHGNWFSDFVKLVRHLAAGFRRLQARQFAAPWQPRRQPHAMR